MLIQKWEEIDTAQEFAELFTGQRVLLATDSCSGQSPSIDDIDSEFYWTFHSGEPGTVGITVQLIYDREEGNYPVVRYWKIVEVEG